MIPVGDSPRTTSTPWVNYAFILANVLVFLYMLGLSTDVVGNRRQQADDFRDQTLGDCYGFRTAPTEIDRFYCEWAFQPREFFDAVKGERPEGLGSPGKVFFSIIAATFIHGGALHILGNMLYLWVFGDNIEDRLGHLRYFLFYLAGGIAAALTQGVLDANSVVPVVGASGAVAAVLGAYLVLFPKASVNVVIPFFILIFIPIPVPAIIMIGLWFLQNLVAGLAILGNAQSPSDGVAWFAHIGGFLFGLVVLLILRPFLRRPPRWHPRG